MAGNLGGSYPGFVTPADANFPYSSYLNESVPGNFDGTPFEAAWPNDIIGFHQALLNLAGIVPTGTADNASSKTSSQYMQSILHMVQSGSIFGESGIADAYVLGVVGLNTAPPAYHDNMTLDFIPGNTNTGASTVDLESIGAKNIFLDGVALVAGDLIAGRLYKIRFSVADDRFNIVQYDVMSKLTLVGNAASPPDANTLTKENIPKGWINFNGTGAIAINDSFNVSGIIDNGVGDYTVTWNTDFADANYAVVGTARDDAGGGVFISFPSGGTYTVGATQILVIENGGTQVDVDTVNLIAFGNQ